MAGGHRLTWAYHNLPVAILQPGGFQALVIIGRFPRKGNICREKNVTSFFLPPKPGPRGFLASTHPTNLPEGTCYTLAKSSSCVRVFHAEKMREGMREWGAQVGI